MTVQQKSSFLNHIFHFILQEFMNNQQGIPPSRNISNLPEAFHQALFDLQVLTWIFMEDSTDEHYTLGARIMILIQLLPIEWKRTICYSLHSNFCTVTVHLRKDPPVQISSNGFGNTISTLYRDKPSNFQMCKHFLTFPYTGFKAPEQAHWNLATILVKKLP